MNISQFYTRRAIGFLILLVIIGLVTAFYSFNNYIDQEKNAGSNSYEPYRASLSGEYVCLPHKISNGPQTDECAFGIKTETGEYYAVDLSPMSQQHEALTVGEFISAKGLVTPIERLSTDQWQKYNVEGMFSITDSLVIVNEGQDSHVCQLDAKICPDGTSVGRQGPNCVFSACPAENATSSRVTTYIGGNATTLNVTASPKEVISDSRCPLGVECIWAGTVEVRTVLSTDVAHSEHVLTLGKPIVFGDYTVTLVEVMPNKTKEEISESSYRFTFEISKSRN